MIRLVGGTKLVLSPLRCVWQHLSFWVVVICFGPSFKHNRSLCNILLITQEAPVPLHFRLLICLHFQTGTTLKADIVSYQLASNILMNISVKAMIGILYTLKSLLPVFILAEF